MIEQLKQYVLENDLYNKAIEKFWIAFNNWKKDFPDKYTEAFQYIPQDVPNIFIHSIGLKSSEWPECKYGHVTITIVVHYERILFGKYFANFSLSDGVEDNDFLEI